MASECSMEQNLPYHERLRLIKLGQLPKEAVAKPKKRIPKISEKRKKELAEQKESSSDKKEDEYFEYWMKNGVPKCEECGMEAFWLLEPQADKEKEKAYKMIWRACHAHVLPKKKTYGFPSLRNELDNHLVLFPSWGGLLCGCHGFYDSNWYNASTMNIWKKAIQIIQEKLYHKIPPNEKKNLSEIILQELNPEIL